MITTTTVLLVVKLVTLDPPLLPVAPMSWEPGNWRLVVQKSGAEGYAEEPFAAEEDCRAAAKAFNRKNRSVASCLR